MRAADIRTFIPAQTKPAQRFQDHFLRLRRGPRLIGIFDTQQEFAPMLFGKAVIDERYIGGATCGSPVGEGATRVRTGRVMAVIIVASFNVGLAGLYKADRRLSSLRCDDGY